MADRYSVSIMDRHRKALRTWFEELSKGGKIPTKTDLEKPFSPEIDSEQVKDVERVLFLSFFLGLDHGSSDLELADGDVIDEPLPFEEAEKFFKSRVSLTKKEWLDLEPKLRFRAFTIAALGDPDIIDKVRTRMISQLKTGGTLESFWNLEKVESMAGVSKKSPFYWETVYRTNMQTSYNAGRAMEYQKTQPEYLEFVGIEDERQTSVCAQRSGIILPATHPFWSTNWPPLHFNCRSTVRGVFKEEIDVIKETNPTWETTPDRNLPREQILGGFGGNPLDQGSFFKLTPSMASRIEANTEIKESLLDLSKKVGLVSNPIETSKLIFSGKAVNRSNLNLEETVDELRNNVQSEIQKSVGKKIAVAELDRPVEITQKGVDHGLAFSASRAKVESLRDLPELIKNMKIIARGLPIEKGKGHLYSEKIAGRVAYSVGSKFRQLQITLFRRKSDQGLELYDVSEWVMKK